MACSCTRVRVARWRGAIGRPEWWARCFYNFAIKRTRPRGCGRNFATRCRRRSKRSDMSIRIRSYRPADLDELKRITLEAFDGIALDQRVEEHLGVLHGRDWRWRKARHIEEDIASNAAGAFVAEE